MRFYLEERRQFKRYPVTKGLLFSDNDKAVSLAKIVDISRSGVKCCSLSQIDCTICVLKNIDLFGTEDDLVLTGLSGRMTRCSNDLSGQRMGADHCFYEFGFEFFPEHYRQIQKLQECLSIYK